MKKVFTVLGSLMIVAGLKAQKDSVIKKETTAPVNTKGIDSAKSKSLPEKQTSSNYLKINNQKALPPKAKDSVKPDQNKINAWPKKYSATTKPTKG
jgi:hypothetical protein